tara:strand:+ start:411 stop:626 length:216 start_codon:yes stop_codon:yes gene_type:complete
MTTITPELKTFMEDLWGSEGDFIDTPQGRGRIENVRAMRGIDLQVEVKIPDVGLALCSALSLFDWETERRW